MEDTATNDTIDDSTSSRNLWKSRLIIATLMILLSLTAILISYFSSKLFETYNQIMAALFTILAIGLQTRINKYTKNKPVINIWHYWLHWAGLLIMIYITTLFKSSGIMDSNQVGLLSLCLIALTTFLAGVYFDPVFLLIGITLGALATCTALFHDHLFLFMFPTLIITGIIIIMIIIRQKNIEKL